jgi:hypothetical protein
MRHTAIRRCAAATIVSVVALGLTSSAQTTPTQPSNVSTDLPWTRVYIDDAFTGDGARRALRGASERLSRPACQLVFSEFQDERGVPLSDKLEELGASPEDYLRLIVFLDAGASPQCRKPGVLAFTRRNSRVVYLCGRDFERAERHDPRAMQVTIIHEMLHSLGLGENPPSPRHISFRVLRRCA